MEYKHLNAKYGGISISIPKSQRRDFDDALAYLGSLGYKVSDAMRTGTILYAQDCGFVPIEKCDNIQQTGEQIARGKMTPTVRYRIMERDNFQCVVCGARSEDSVKLVVDHLFPVSKGGETVDGNLQTLCQECNKGKGGRIPKVVNGES